MKIGTEKDQNGEREKKAKGNICFKGKMFFQGEVSAYSFLRTDYLSPRYIPIRKNSLSQAINFSREQFRK